jgi:hypothetical protein
MSTHSWLWFTLIGCWLSMSEKTLLKSIILKIPQNQSLINSLNILSSILWKIFMSKVDWNGRTSFIIKASQGQKLEWGPIWKILISSFKSLLFQEINYLYLLPIFGRLWKSSLGISWTTPCHLNISIFSSQMNSWWKMEFLFPPMNPQMNHGEGNLFLDLIFIVC